MIEKLVIGTAQFASNYGISNSTGAVESLTAKKILFLANNLGANSIDTAINYPDCHKILGEIGVEQFNITTKISEIAKSEKNIPLFIENQIKNSCHDLKVSTINTILLHRPDQLFESIGEQIIKSLYECKQSGLVEKIGISIYDPKELDYIHNIFDFDVVQCPINIFDRRMELSGQLNKFNKLGKEIHARSIFLQGLLLMTHDTIPSKFAKWRSLLNKWNKFNNYDHIKKIETALNYVLSLDEVDKVVIGFQSEKELEQVSELFKTKKISIPESLMSNDELLLNPNNWSKL